LLPRDLIPPERQPQIIYPTMIRTILSIAILTALASGSLQAEPKNSKKSKSEKNKPTATTTVATTSPLASGWSCTNGVWMHSDGYKFVNGQVIRTGIQTHKKAPKPPTKEEMDAALKKPRGPKTAAEIATEKAKERERNLAPRPAPQTGSHF
jgi:hypothetical protein